MRVTRTAIEGFGLAGLLAVVMALAAFLLAGKLAIDRATALQDADTAVATVLKQEVRPTSSRRTTQWTEVRFSLPNGRSVTAWIGGTLAIPEGAASVKVIYKRADPHDFVVDGDPTAYVLAALAAALGCGLLVAAWAAERSRRAKRG